jgi:hypothetical protein
VSSALARSRWRVLRRGRLRAALTALREGRSAEALSALDHAGSDQDESAGLLRSVATVMAAPGPANADRCVAALERAGEGLGPDESSVALAVLERVLRASPGDDREFVAQVAGLSDRLMRVAGPFAPGRYNLAVYAMQTGRFEDAAGHFGAGATAPPGGWPVPLLATACAAVLGRPAELSHWLGASPPHPNLADDRHFLGAVHEVFAALRDDRPLDPARLGRVFGGPPGPLTRVVPQLAALKTLLADAVRLAPSRVPAADLDGCAWGRWLCDRLRYAGGEATDVLRAYAGPDVEDPAGAWQRLGSQQDLLPLLTGEHAGLLRQRLAAFRRHPRLGASWAHLVDLREHLTSGSADAAGGASGDAETTMVDAGSRSCPWWPADGVLQALAGREAGVERRYLEGRYALRDGQAADAGRRFADGRARLSGDGLATRLIGLRFDPLLRYWEGVALAHMNLPGEAARLLFSCGKGVKAREAAAQLGLLAVAVGDLDTAAKWRSVIGEPRPASADYLDALLAARHGPAAETDLLVERLETRAPVAGPYAAAGQRLAGRLREAGGELGEAAERYRRALTLRGGDIVAAARLARVWLRRRYDGEVPAEPLLDPRWSRLSAVDWAANLPALRDCLDGTPALDRIPADRALRLLALHTAVGAGEETAATAAARTWAEEDDPDPAVVRVARAAEAVRAMRAFCRDGGQGEARRDLAELPGRLDPGDPVLAFWAGAARLLLDPDAIASAPALAALEDESRSAPVRLFAGLLSVFAEGAEQRAAGAAVCRASLETVADPLARAAVRCLAADALGDDQEFLAAYGEIETDPGVLPCDPASTYLAATEARLRVGDLDAIVEGFIPEQVADLAHPGVRRAMGVAYARRAVRSADRNLRAALQDLDQARELIQEVPS